MTWRVLTSADARRRSTIYNTHYGHRPVTAWGGGDLPAPWAEGDVVRTFPGVDLTDRRYDGIEAGEAVVVYAASIGDGDEWFFRVAQDPDEVSGRLHVYGPGLDGFAEQAGADWMAPFDLVETSDPHGLRLREAMLAGGWTAPPQPARCETCGQALR